jgi:hypothetical protein
MHLLVSLHRARGSFSRCIQVDADVIHSAFSMCGSAARRDPQQGRDRYHYAAASSSAKSRSAAFIALSPLHHTVRLHATAPLSWRSDGASASSRLASHLRQHRYTELFENVRRDHPRLPCEVVHSVRMHQRHALLGPKAGLKLRHRLQMKLRSAVLFYLSGYGPPPARPTVLETDTSALPIQSFLPMSRISCGDQPQLPLIRSS